PGSWLPALFEIAQHAARAGLMVADVENLWRHYVKTAHAWDAGFRAERADFVTRHGERFVRMWELYLQAMEGGFRAGALQLWQVVLLEGKEAPWPLDREVRVGARSAQEPQDRPDVALEAGSDRLAGVLRPPAGPREHQTMTAKRRSGS